MKKIITLLMVVSISFIISGCGQEVTMTIFNRGNNVGYGSWLIGSVNSEDGVAESFSFQGRAMAEADIDELNSFTVTLKENMSVMVSANGEQLVFADDGSYSTQATNIASETATIYGGFPDAPDWYAAINAATIVIYKK